MELKEFIAETLSNIILGVKEAQDKLEIAGAAINPRIWQYEKNFDRPLLNSERHVEFIEFEVGLKLEEKEGSKASISIFSGILGGVEGNSSEINQSVNRIKFRIPMAYPQQEIKKTQ